jgi:hypothetical protein
MKRRKERKARHLNRKVERNSLQNERYNKNENIIDESDTNEETLEVHELHRLSYETEPFDVESVEKLDNKSKQVNNKEKGGFDKIVANEWNFESDSSSNKTLKGSINRTDADFRPIHRYAIIKLLVIKLSFIESKCDNCSDISKPLYSILEEPKPVIISGILSPNSFHSAKNAMKDAIKAKSLQVVNQKIINGEKKLDMDLIDIEDDELWITSCAKQSLFY